VPSTLLSSRSCVLGPGGIWVAADCLPFQTNTWGCDRHGRLTLHEVQLSRREGRSGGAQVFVGTESTCGVLPIGCRVFGKDGRRWAVSDLMERAGAGGTYVETITAPPPAIAPSRDIESLWTMLSRSAPFRSAHSVAHRFRDTSSGDAAKCCSSGPIGRSIVSRGAQYLIVERRAFAEAVMGGWTCALTELATAWSHGGEPDALQFFVATYEPLMWLLSAWRVTGKGHSLEYDGPCHSVFVVARSRPATPQPFSCVQCVFQLAKTEGEYEMHWKSNTWSPVVNGFLVAT
jgi:hypothetical protein